jgi:hypothetical protein
MRAEAELTDEGKWVIKFDFRQTLSGTRFSTLEGYCDKSFIDAIVAALEAVEE